ncbi:YrhB domain-containing protein [Streptomyces sp. UNOC14_S4]|uniref:YrhB domain-containing protein n=1 Tax=Streptomyces sp. UNOC14_S4 TaxID=2872340 RepID=UPI001E35AA17|nr:YrhB domain-containing protein [Streptomyces sp. UNOC14_S4]MCC3770767.1 YrhB family protein [Streptomyces sp. UNOC14_S4]
MIEREFAIRVVQEELDRKYAGRLVVDEVEEHELVWIVHYASVEYVRTRDPREQLGGAGPYLVDRLDGSLHSVGVVSWLQGVWEGDYRTRIRKIPVRTAVDDLHDEVRHEAAAHGRIRAMYLLRQRVGTLTHAQAAAYVTALQAGAVPPSLTDIATELLVPVLSPVLRVGTVRGPRGPEGAV